jgi:hypothetical protein
MNDHHLQQLLLQAEVAPPSQAWEMIAIVLDELEEDRPLQQKILSVVNDVPSFNWNAIEQRLEDVFYAEHLEQAAVEVPLNAWEKINAQLDEEADESIAAKLIAVKENPPAKVWPEIEEQLNKDQTAKVISFRKNYVPAYRLAAAAAITGLLAWGAYRLLNTNEPVVTAVAVNQPAQIQEKKSAPPGEIKTEEPNEITVPVNTSRLNIKKRIKEELISENTVAFQEPVNHGSQVSSPVQDAHHKNQTPVVETGNFSENQYLMVLNEAGDLIRVSKKLSNMQCAKDGAELPVDAATALQSKNCDEQIKRWQQKIAASTAISPSAGYIDLNEIILATEK